MVLSKQQFHEQSLQHLYFVMAQQRIDDMLISMQGSIVIMVSLEKSLAKINKETLDTVINLYESVGWKVSISPLTSMGEYILLVFE